MRMLQKAGTEKLFPFTDILAQRPDMVLVDVDTSVKKSEFKTSPFQKPGPGWYKNRKGTWSRSKK
jgi:hypothetical protein